MISMKCTRSIFGLLTRQFQFSKHCLSNINHQLAFLHNTKLLCGSNSIEIKMPALSPTMTEGTIVKWLKKEGDTIEPGDVLCEIQTDKAVVGLETEEEGVLGKIVMPEDSKNVQLGEIIAIIVAEGEAVDLPSTPTKKVEDEKPKDITKHAKSDPDRLIGPSVKKLLHEYDIKISSVSSSGPRDNLLKGDILNYIKQHNLKQAVHVEDKPKPKKSQSPKAQSRKGKHLDIPLTTTDAQLAQKMLQSKKTIPHGYMSMDCKVDKVLEVKKKFEKDGIDVSLDEFIVRSVAMALKQAPKLKAIRQNGQLKISESVNISISNFGDGNYKTSIVQNADRLNLRLISEKMKSSQVNESSPASADGTFRISNLGMFSVSEFSEVISPTDVATLAVGGTRFVLEEDKPVKKLKVTLSFDNSIIGEDEAGEFLEMFKLCLENPLNSLSLG